MSDPAALERAVRTELTHGGIIDRIAHESSIIGAYCRGEVDAEDAAKIREAARRLDVARDEFIDRMHAALGAQRPADGAFVDAGNPNGPLAAQEAVYWMCREKGIRADDHDIGHILRTAAPIIRGENVR